MLAHGSHLYCGKLLLLFASDLNCLRVKFGRSNLLSKISQSVMPVALQFCEYTQPFAIEFTMKADIADWEKSFT